MLFCGPLVPFGAARGSPGHSALRLSGGHRGGPLFAGQSSDVAGPARNFVIPLVVVNAVPFVARQTQADSTTSSAAASGARGTSNPSDFAVVMLMASSNFVGC